MNKEELKLTEYLHSIIEENISLRRNNDKLWKDKLEYIGRISKATEYIEEHLKESEVKIYGIPKCKIFMGSVEELLNLLKGDKE